MLGYLDSFALSGHTRLAQFNVWLKCALTCITVGVNTYYRYQRKQVLQSELQPKGRNDDVIT